MSFVYLIGAMNVQSTKKPVTTMLTYPWKCTVLHCNHLGNTWKPLVLMTRHFDYCPSASEGDNQSVRSSAPVVFRCFPGGYNVKLYISRGRLAWWLLAFLHSGLNLNLEISLFQSHMTTICKGVGVCNGWVRSNNLAQPYGLTESCNVMGGYEVFEGRNKVWEDEK